MLLPASLQDWLPKDLFVQVFKLAREMGLVNLGTVAIDGTKIKAYASGHKALSHESANGRSAIEIAWQSMVRHRSHGRVEAGVRIYWVNWGPMPMINSGRGSRDLLGQRRQSLQMSRRGTVLNFEIAPFEPFQLAQRETEFIVELSTGVFPSV